MLVLTRKPDQSIIVAGEIEITILEVRGEQVRVGIRAPRSIAIHRKEVFDQIREANQTALDATSGTSGTLETLETPATITSLDDLIRPPAAA